MTTDIGPALSVWVFKITLAFRPRLGQKGLLSKSPNRASHEHGGVAGQNWRTARGKCREESRSGKDIGASCAQQNRPERFLQAVGRGHPAQAHGYACRHRHQSFNPTVRFRIEQMNVFLQEIQSDGLTAGYWNSSIYDDDTFGRRCRCDEGR